MERHSLASDAGPRPVTLDYLAGMIDADGCVRIKGNTTQYVSITNRHLPVLSEIQERFGGHLRIDRNVYRYEIMGEGARSLLREIYPILREKKEQARLCLLFSDFPPRSRMRALIDRRIRDLKRTCYIMPEVVDEARS